MEPILFRLPSSLKRAFRILAASKGISMNALAIIAFKDFISRQDKEAA